MTKEVSTSTAGRVLIMGMMIVIYAFGAIASVAWGFGLTGYRIGASIGLFCCLTILIAIYYEVLE